MRDVDDEDKESIRDTMRSRMAIELTRVHSDGFNVQDVLTWFRKNRSGVPETTIRTELIALTVNHPSRHHYYRRGLIDDVFERKGERRNARYFVLINSSSEPKDSQQGIEESSQAEVPVENIDAVYEVKSYQAACRRGSGQEKVICMLLTEPGHLLDPDENRVLAALEKEGLEKAIGIYFYLFKDIEREGRFVKIGETTGPDGIGGRIKRGMFGKGTDSYVLKKSANGILVKKDFAKAIDRISIDAPLYFVFYEHALEESHPKIDEAIAFEKHLRCFGKMTESPEKVNRQAARVGRNLVFHESAFDEVRQQIFPDLSKYPD